MKTIKIIDLLNRCMNYDETLPLNIEYQDNIYRRQICGVQYYLYLRETPAKTITLIQDLMYFCDLYREVEIIEDAEEDKEIEKIVYIGYGEDGNMQYELASKLNEVIEAVNKLNKKD